MNETEAIVNRVEKSGLITLDLADYRPVQEIIELDIAAFLYEGIILKEKEFRTHIQELHTDQYVGKIIALFCSEDAIIPLWAWMLVSQKLSGIAANIVFGKKQEVYTKVFLENMQQQLDPASFAGKKIIIKGCGDQTIPEDAYVYISVALTPYVNSLMYGEACSTVPIYKKPKA